MSTEGTQKQQQPNVYINLFDDIADAAVGKAAQRCSPSLLPQAAAAAAAARCRLLRGRLAPTSFFDDPNTKGNAEQRNKETVWFVLFNCPRTPLLPGGWLLLGSFFQLLSS